MSGKIRRSFTSNELGIATATGYIRTIDRFYRPKIRGYPIDDQEPTIATDRDDAVFAEKIPGGYLLHVTIADVAAHIPKDSPLDKAAQARAFTIYRPPARDPMFPFILSEDRFSLEHEQERLGVTATLELNETFQFRDIRFARTVIASHCINYASASHRMIQEGDDFELLARLAKGIREAARPPIHPYGASDSAYMDKTGLLRHGDAGTMAAAKLVQVMMIFANNEIANFFNRTGLPFLFRNHAGGEDNEGRAEYEPFDRGHYALRSDGLIGAYSHCTSPIRRYADLVNQRMMHYCMDVLTALAGEIAAFLPEKDRRDKKALLPVAWDYGEGVLSGVLAVHRACGNSRPGLEAELKKRLREVLHAIIPADGELYRRSDPIAQLVAAVLGPVLPYTHDELAGIAPGLNMANKSERAAITELNRRNLAKWNEKIQDDLNAGNFDVLSLSAFSGVLRRACVTGRVNEALTRETIARFSKGTMDLVPDSYSILILNKDYQHVYWRAVKRAALNAIERDPMATNNLFEKAIKEGEIHADTHVVESVVRDSATESSMPLLKAAGVEPQVDAALVVTRMEDLGNREYAAPHFSVGYTKKDTARHARFNFIRAMTFGELGPVDQTILPTPLFAELTQGRSRAKVLREMVESMDMTMRELGPRERPDGQLSFAYQVYGPGIEHSIIGFVVEPGIDEAREKSATRILRSMQFKRAYANQHPVELGFPSNPIYVVREMAEARGWVLREPERTEILEIDRGIFQAEVVLVLDNGEEIRVVREARNKDNAFQFCYQSLRDQLVARGQLPQEGRGSGEGWVTWPVMAAQETVPAE